MTASARTPSRVQIEIDDLPLPATWSQAPIVELTDEEWADTSGVSAGKIEIVDGEGIRLGLG